MEQRINELISKMTVEEKVGQLWQVCLSNCDVENIKKLAREGKIGSCILSSTPLAGNTESQERVSIDNINSVQKEAFEHSRHGIPIMYGFDVIHGQRLIYPVPLAQAATWEPDLVQEAARRMADEAKHDGVHWTFAPMVDIVRDPRWGRIIESFGEDPYLASVMAKTSVTGIQHKDENGNINMAACAKHYVGYGGVEGGREYTQAEITEYTIHNVYLPPFESAVENDVLTIMSSFTSIGGEPVITNRHLLVDILKKGLKFNGFVISDYGSIEQLISRRMAENPRQCAEMAFNGGVDMEMASSCYADYMTELINENIIPVEDLDEAVRRILRVKMRLGLFENPYVKTDVNQQYKKADYDFSLKVAEQSTVLLKNRDSILPLSKDKKIALIGPYLDEKRALLGSWAGYGDAENVKTFAAAMKEEFGKSIVYSDKKFDEKRLNSVLCRETEIVVLALGEMHSYTGERSSVANIEIEAEQVELAKRAYLLGKKVVVVIFAGRPRALTSIGPYTDAIVYAWHPGSTGGQAAANILSGKVNPSGKLPVSMLRSSGQIPLYYNIENNPCCVSDPYYEEPMFPPYLDFVSTPMFEFGYGLSYSKITIGDICSDKYSMTLQELKNGGKFIVSVNGKNESEVDGQEVVQLYVTDTISRKCRPVKELKAFRKVFVASGENKRVEFEIGFNSFKYYVPENGTVVEPGEFEISVGNSCFVKDSIIVMIKP